MKSGHVQISISDFRFSREIGGRGVWRGPKSDYVILEQPLMLTQGEVQNQGKLADVMLEQSLSTFTLDNLNFNW